MPVADPAHLEPPVDLGPTAAAVASRPASGNPPSRVGAALASVTTQRVVGWLLIIWWAGWLASLWAAQPRMVPQDVVVDELTAGRATAYRVVVVEEHGDGLFDGTDRIEISPASDADDGVVDGAADGRQLTVAYWVDAPIGGLRVLDTDGLGSDAPTEVAERFRAAGVPEAAAGDLYVRSPAGRTYTAGALLMALTLALVVLGPRPSRGTRWFWFWLLFAPLFLAVPLFAVAERLRPRRWPEGTEHPKGVAGRWNGLTGLAVGVLLSLATTAALRALAGASPIWFIRG